jgi:hypothetical protein
MAKRATFLVQILDKIGAPLLAATESSPAGDADGVQAAQTMASLLTKAVQMSVTLSQSMDLQGTEEDADSIRLSLAALAGDVIAEGYKATQKVPDDADLARMSKALEAVLSFSDNFAPAQAHISRLQSLDDIQVHSDEDQNTVYVMKALLPVVSAVAEFPFGQPETNLMQDIARKLQADAKAMTAAILAQGEVDASKMRYVELMTLRALATLYAECHKAQTKKLIEANGSIEPSLDPVWQAYDVRRGLLESVAGATLPGGAQGVSGQGAVAPAAQPPQQEQAPQPPEQVQAQPQPQAAPVAPQPAAPPAAPPPAQAPAEQASDNPMSFFSKKETSSQPAAAQPEQAPAAQPAPQQAAPQAPAETPAAPAADSDNPMSFFKPGAKKDDQNGNA